MNGFRVLLVSNTRPSRAWRFARRLEREVAGAKVCGIVQRHLSELPTEQQQLALAKPNGADALPGLWSRLRSCGRSCADFFVHGVLWFVHGCPRKLNVRASFTVRTLAEKCAAAGWPLFTAKSLLLPAAAEFISSKSADLMVVLGDASSLPKLSKTPRFGILSARVQGVLNRTAQGAYGLQIEIERLDSENQQAETLACATLPRQVYETPVGFTLKEDLVVDDLLSHAAVGLARGGVSEAKVETAAFVENVLAPYLAQTGPSRPATRPGSRRWYRSAWSLTAETLLLCSPMLIARNWVRRLRGRYPVLILVHHLVSDRAHRMSIPTETFWRQVLFLRRHYAFASLAQSAEILRSGRAEAPTVSLTFDDGYADNFVSLRAVADELGIPVALFITTHPVEFHREFQHDVIKGQLGTFPLTWAQIRCWKDRGAEFGTHTRTHIKCGTVHRAKLEEEIVGSEKDFESRLGEKPQFFAFPYGNRQDCPPEAMEIAAGSCPYFLSAFGGENIPDRERVNPHLYRKNAYPEPWELELELQSVFDFVDGTKRVFRNARGNHQDRIPQQTPVLIQGRAASGANGLQSAQRLIKP
jgi:peptidoglycan/xylan/chitin deacetylase (PgdA/CDA1 family)